MTDQTAERPSDEYMRQVVDKYADLLWNYPHHTSHSFADHRDDDGNLTGGYGITIAISEWTDPTTLPEERRVPDCLDGVPVRFVIEGPNRLLWHKGE